MEKKKSALQKAHDKLQTVEIEFQEFKDKAEEEFRTAKVRVSNRDFYQGVAWGGGVVAFIAILLVVFI